MDLILSSLSGLALGTTVLLLLATAVLVAARSSARPVAVLASPDAAIRRRTALLVAPVASDRAADPRHHPLRPRAPGTA